MKLMYPITAKLDTRLSTVVRSIASTSGIMRADVTFMGNTRVSWTSLCADRESNRTALAQFYRSSQNLMQLNL